MVVGGSSAGEPTKGVSINRVISLIHKSTKKHMWREFLHQHPANRLSVHINQLINQLIAGST